MNQPQLGSFESIALSAIRPSSTNPRKHFDQAALDDLTASIRESGVQQPIIVRHVGADALSNKYELICGARRLKAAAAAGLKEIPAIIRDLDDDEAYRTQILENLQREDLGAMEEAEGYAVLTKQGLSSQEIATKVGKPAAYVHQRIKLLELAPKAQKALREGALQLGFALELAKLKGKEQDEAFGWCVGDTWQRPRSVDALRNQINENFRLQLKTAPFSTKATNLHPTAGSCVECPNRTGADSLLFDDIQGGDRCLDSKCYKTKVETLIHIRVEEVKKVQGSAQLISQSYYPQNAPNGTLCAAKYASAEKPNPTCDNSELAVIVDGPRIGQKMRICTMKDCSVHRPGGHDRLDAAAQKKRLEADRKAKLEQKVRIRVAEKLAELVLADASRMIDDRDVLDLAVYAFHRMDGSQTSRLAKILGWDQKLFRYDGGNGGKARVAKLEELGPGKAAALAVLASVAGEFTVQHTWGNNSAPSSKLVALAKRNGVDVEAIRKQVTDEAKTKAGNKGVTKKTVATTAPKKKVRKLNAAGKKRIAEAMRKRWAQQRKAGV